MAKQNRYREMERSMTKILLWDFVLFLLYLLFAGIGIIWLKILLSIAIILISGGCLAFLYLSQELFRVRSRWMTAASGSILICLLVSLILSFP